MTPHFHTGAPTPSERRGCSPAVWIIVLASSVVVVMCGGMVLAGVLAYRTAMGTMMGGPTVSPTRTETGMSPLWTATGAGGAVACDSASGEAYAQGPSDVTVYDRAGSQTRRIAAAGGVTSLVLARLDSDPELEVVTADFTDTLVAREPDGTQLWTWKPPGGGASNIEASDLDGDGLDELLLVTYYGSVTALSPTGTEEWSFGGSQDTSCLSAGDVDGDGSTEVLLSGFSSTATVLDSAGTVKSRLTLSQTDTPAWALPESSASGATWVTLDGTPGSYELVGRKPDGSSVWTLPLAWDMVWDAQAVACPGYPLLAVATADGDVVVLNTETGAEVASGFNQGYGLSLAWLDRPGDSPLLLISDYTELRAMELTSPPPLSPATESTESAEPGSVSERPAEKPLAPKPPVPSAESAESAESTPAVESRPKPTTKWVD